VIREFEGLGARVDVFDPWVDPEEVLREYGLSLVREPENGAYDAIVLAVAHRQFAAMGADGIRALGRDPHVLYDVKQMLPADAVDGRL
jgi:UDP-N-acetyl-D-galactosamine dehydrogenase